MRPLLMMHRTSPQKNSACLFEFVHYESRTVGKRAVGIHWNTFLYVDYILIQIDNKNIVL